MTHVNWHPYPKEKPESYTREYLLTIRDVYGKDSITTIKIDTWADSETGGDWELYGMRGVVAWAELPEPYSKEMKSVD